MEDPNSRIFPKVLEAKLLTFSLDLSLKSLKNALEIKSYMISFFVIYYHIYQNHHRPRINLALLGLLGSKQGNA